MLILTLMLNKVSKQIFGETCYSFLLGFTGLFYGADWLIGSVVEIATNHGISEKS